MELRNYGNISITGKVFPMLAISWKKLKKQEVSELLSESFQNKKDYTKDSTSFSLILNK